MGGLKFFSSLLLVCILASCSNDELAISKNFSNQKVDLREEDPPSGPGETVLGAELNNPYDIANMNNAYQLLTGQAGNLEPTHYYIRFSPTTGDHIVDIADYEEANDYEFESQPIHYEVVYEGEEGYVDPSVGEGGFGPEYGAITAEDYDLGKIPNIPYQVLNVMHIPKYETKLTFTAFVISGNEQYYEAVDGLCHPDCPTWPDCLEDSTLTCQIDSSSLATLTTIDP